MVAGAIRTDFILSAEIMVIALNEVGRRAVRLARDHPGWSSPSRITVLVYGVVALIVKMDDVGLHLDRADLAGSRSGSGTAWSRAMPRLLSGHLRRRHAAMLWVGGHILPRRRRRPRLALRPYDLVHHWEEDVARTPSAGIGAPLGWLVNTLASAVVGLVVGASWCVGA